MFLQQLGRGLRRADNKAVLTVLDFIGQQRREFRFDVKYGALLDVPRKKLERIIDDGAPGLPSGCQLMLDRVARTIVLENIRAQLKLNKPALVNGTQVAWADWLGPLPRRVRPGREEMSIAKRAIRGLN